MDPSPPGKWLGKLPSVSQVFTLSGSDALRMHEMRKHLGWFYGRLAKSPKASSPKWTPFLPKFIAAPDVPIAKYCKHSTREVTINDGIHWHGLASVNPLTPKLHVPMDLHIKANVHKYCLGSIKEIDGRMITHTPRYVTSYAMKVDNGESFENGRSVWIWRGVPE